MTAMKQGFEGIVTTPAKAKEILRVVVSRTCAHVTTAINVVHDQFCLRTTEAAAVIVASQDHVSVASEIPGKPARLMGLKAFEAPLTAIEAESDAAISTDPEGEKLVSTPLHVVGLPIKAYLASFSIGNARLFDTEPAQGLRFSSGLALLGLLAVRFKVLLAHTVPWLCRCHANPAQTFRSPFFLTAHYGWPSLGKFCKQPAKTFGMCA